MSFHLDIEAWFDHTDFEVTHRHPGSGHEFHIDVAIRTDFNGEHSIKLQLDETRARALRDKLTAALQDCYFEHERPHREEPPLVDRSPQKADDPAQCETPSCGNEAAPGKSRCRVCILDAVDAHDKQVGRCLIHPEFRVGECPICLDKRVPTDA